MIHHHRERRDPGMPNRLRRRTRDFNAKYGDVAQVALGTILLCVAVAVVLVALQVRQSTANSHSSSHDLCQRSARFGPAIADFFDRQGVFEARYGPERGAKVMRAYRATIPSSCP